MASIDSAYTELLLLETGGESLQESPTLLCFWLSQPKLSTRTLLPLLLDESRVVVGTSALLETRTLERGQENEDTPSPPTNVYVSRFMNF